VTGLTTDLTLEIVDLPPKPAKYSVGASYYVRYFDSDPPPATSTKLGLTLRRDPPTVKQVLAVGDI
jgi:hypothetical protein